MAASRASLVVSLIGWLGVAGVAFGSFGGNWQGWGMAHDADGWKAPCDRIAYHFEHSEHVLTLISGQVSCGDLRTDFDPVSLTIQDGHLYYEELKVGTIDDREMNILFEDEDLVLKYNFKKRVVDGLNGSATYLEYTHYEASESGAVTIEGTLHQTD